MLKKIVNRISKKPAIFNFLRRIIEFDFIAIKKTINKELSGRTKILDAPCGTGEFCGLFDAKDYTGIDISQGYIDYAKKMYRKSFYCRDARKNGFEESCFDAVLTLGLFHHLDMQAVISVLEETKRVLKKDGKFLLIEDAPAVSSWNFIGRFLQRYDVGDSIRPAEEYRENLERFFEINRYYPLKNGFWNYSVFVLSPK